LKAKIYAPKRCRSILANIPETSGFGGAKLVKIYAVNKENKAIEIALFLPETKREMCF
jgi:hypothetical protein